MNMLLVLRSTSVIVILYHSSLTKEYGCFQLIDKALDELRRAVCTLTPVTALGGPAR